MKRGSDAAAKTNDPDFQRATEQSDIPSVIPTEAGTIFRRWAVWVRFEILSHGPSGGAIESS